MDLTRVTTENRDRLLEQVLLSYGTVIAEAVIGASQLKKRMGLPPDSIDYAAIMFSAMATDYGQRDVDPELKETLEMLMKDDSMEGTVEFLESLVDSEQVKIIIRECHKR